MKGGHGQTNQLHDINWGTFNHASHVPQLMSCRYYLCTCMNTHVREEYELASECAGNMCVNVWSCHVTIIIQWL